MRVMKGKGENEKADSRPTSRQAGKQACEEAGNQESQKHMTISKSGATITKKNMAVMYDDDQTRKTNQLKSFMLEIKIITQLSGRLQGKQTARCALTDC